MEVRSAINQPEVALVYDGSLEGLLSAVFIAYKEMYFGAELVKPTNLQARLGQEVIVVETNNAHALRVQRGVCLRCGPQVFEAIKSTSLSDNPQIGTIIYRFLRYALQTHEPMDCTRCSRKKKCGGICSREPQNGPLSKVMHPDVAPLIKENRSVHNERHAIMQFLRFRKLEGDIWFACCNPKASVVPLIMDWFMQRFSSQPFLVYDEIHHLAGVCDGQNWYLVKTEELTLPSRTDDDYLMEHAWKSFYQKVSVESRYHPELRRQFMPKRFWRNIVEMHEDNPGTALDLHKEKAHTPVPSKEGMKLSSAEPSSW